MVNVYRGIFIRKLEGGGGGIRCPPPQKLDWLKEHVLYDSCICIISIQFLFTFSYSLWLDIIWKCLKGRIVHKFCRVVVTWIWNISRMLHGWRNIGPSGSKLLHFNYSLQGKIFLPLRGSVNEVSFLLWEFKSWN